MKLCQFALDLWPFKFYRAIYLGTDLLKKKLKVHQYFACAQLPLGLHSCVLWILFQIQKLCPSFYLFFINFPPGLPFYRAGDPLSQLTFLEFEKYRLHHCAASLHLHDIRMIVMKGLRDFHTEGLDSIQAECSLGGLRSGLRSINLVYLKTYW